jgi:hypothetical protein
VHRTRKAWISVACLAVGLAVFLSCLAPVGGRERAPGIWWVPTLLVVGGLGVALVLAGVRRPLGRLRAACLAAAAALGNALTAALMKSAMGTLTEQGVSAFIRTWQTYGFAVVGGVSLVLLGTAMQAGPLIASQPALTLTDAVASVLLGVTVYAEQPRTGIWLVAALGGFGLLAYGVFALSRTRCLADCLQVDEDAPDSMERAAT